MAFNLAEIEQRINAIAGQSLTTTEGDTDWLLRRSFINRAQQDWANRFDWPQLYTEVNSMTSTGSALASIALPANFKKLAGYPQFAVGGANGDQFSEVDAMERNRFSSTDKYCYVLGNATGYNLIVNPGTFSSGTSLFYSYYRSPISLISGSDITECPDANYIVQQSLYYYFLSQEDARFQDTRAEAERILATMLEEQTVRGVGYHNQVLNTDETKWGFRWGRD